MEYQLRERNRPTLEEMQSANATIEANLLAKRAKLRNERRGIEKDETSPSDIKIDILTKCMEILMDRIENMERKPKWDNQQALPVRNPNFKKKENIGKNGLDQYITPPFQENFAETYHLEDPEQDTKINLMGLKL